MGNFDFGGIKDTQAVSSGNFLRPWNVYENVKFGGISDPVTGNRQDGSTWTAWDFKFESPNGNYTERIFEPGTNDGRRPYTDSKGVERQFPSSHETNLTFVTQLLNAFNPQGLETLREKASKIETYAQLIALTGKLLEKSTKTTKLKLVGRNRDGKVYCALPTFCAINKDGVKYTSDNFIGDTVALSAWELSKKKEYESATPTDMSKADKSNSSSNQSTASEEVDDLLNSL